MYKHPLCTSQGCKCGFPVFAARWECLELKSMGMVSQSTLYTCRGSTHMLMSAYVCAYAHLSWFFYIWGVTSQIQEQNKLVNWSITALILLLPSVISIQQRRTMRQWREEVHTWTLPASTQCSWPSSGAALCSSTVGGRHPRPLPLGALAHSIRQSAAEPWGIGICLSIFMHSCHWYLSVYIPDVSFPPFSRRSDDTSLLPPCLSLQALPGLPQTPFSSTLPNFQTNQSLQR